MSSRALIVALLCAAVAGGCAKAPPVPADVFFRLPDPRPVAGAQLTDAAIVVRALRADGLRSERALLYVDDAADVTLQQQHYHFWAESPPRLVQAQLIQYLRLAGASPMVIGGTDAPAELVVSGRLRRFERRLSGEQAAVVEIELQLERDGHGLVLVRDYAAEVPAGEGFDSAIAAFAEALDKIFADFLADARASLR